MSKHTIHWRNLTLIFVLMALAGLFGFLASLTGERGWLIPQVVVWLAALVLLTRSGRP